jgi:hypothetical protein
VPATGLIRQTQDLGNHRTPSQNLPVCCEGLS